MKVLQNGNEIEYIKTCRDCRSKLLFTMNDVTVKREEYYEYYAKYEMKVHYITCPVCKTIQRVSL